MTGHLLLCFLHSQSNPVVSFLHQLGVVQEIALCHLEQLIEWSEKKAKEMVNLFYYRRLISLIHAIRIMLYSSTQEG